MEHLVTHQGIKYVLPQVITDPERKWVTTMRFSKLLSRGIKSKNMKKMTASHLGIHWKDAQGKLLRLRIGDFLILEDAISLLCLDAQVLSLGGHQQIHNSGKPPTTLVRSLNRETRNQTPRNQTHNAAKHLSQLKHMHSLAVLLRGRKGRVRQIFETLL